METPKPDKDHQNLYINLGDKEKRIRMYILSKKVRIIYHILSHEGYDKSQEELLLRCVCVSSHFQKRGTCLFIFRIVFQAVSEKAEQTQIRTAMRT